jgi:hypothetical protein
MANQGRARREILELLAKASIASQFPGFSRWVFAGEPQQHEHNSSSAPTRPATYMPQYFTPAEYHTLDVLAELIIPRDETPGAHDAGVAEFIDFMAAHGDEEIQKPMRNGLAWLNDRAKDKGGVDFVDLPGADQTAILQSVTPKNPMVVSGNPAGLLFFRLIRRYTVMGYYTSRIGLEELDYPGLKLYTQSPACPHKDDPEHRHLPPPRY